LSPLVKSGLVAVERDPAAEHGTVSNEHNIAAAANDTEDCFRGINEFLFW
jgi:hypothetical protein